MRTHALLLSLCLLPACTPADEAPSGSEGATVEIRVSPLTLPDLTEVTYTLTVRAGSETVWTRTVSSSRFGDGAGALSYVGTCDAEQNPNRVQLVIDAIETTSGTLVDGVDFTNPAPAGSPVERSVQCDAMTDVQVTFDLTVARAARQGFFDIGVTFDDIFCSAKLDCLRDGGAGDEPLELLFHPHTGERDQTCVVAFACTAGPDADDTWLHMDDVSIVCDGGVTFTVSPDEGPGNLGPDFPGPPNDTHILYQAAVYRGEEPLAAAKKGYWNLALGLNEDAFAALGPCTIEAAGTATDGDLTDGATPEGAVWPYIRWSRELIDGDGELVATRHASGDGSGVVDVVYTGIEGAEFDASFNPSTGEVHRNFAALIPGAYPAPQSPATLHGHTIDGRFTGYPVAPWEWTGAVPFEAPSADRFYFDYDGTYLYGILEGFTCPEALDSDEGVHIAIGTENGAVGWRMYVTPGGVRSVTRNAVDVTGATTADGAIAFSVSPASPDTAHYMIEFRVPTGPGGFSYQIVGSDAACAVPGQDVIIYGSCPTWGGVWGPLPGQPLAGLPPAGSVVAGGLVVLPGTYPALPTAHVEDVEVPVVYMDDDSISVGIPGWVPPGEITIRVCLGPCVEHTVLVTAGPVDIGQPAVALGGAPDGEFTGGGPGGVWFEWGRAMPAAGSYSRVCSCGWHAGNACTIVDWHGGDFGDHADADKLVVYAGDADGNRLAVVGLPDGSVNAYLNGAPYIGTAGAVTHSYSPWEGDTSLVMEFCLPLPFDEYVLGVTGPCSTGLCDEAQAIDVVAWDGGRYTVQSPTDDPRIIVVGPGDEADNDVYSAATSPGGVGIANVEDFVVRGANLGGTAGTAHFTSDSAGPSGVSWSSTRVSGPIPKYAVAGDFFLRTAGAVDTNTVDIHVTEVAPPTPSCVWLRDNAGATTTGVYSYDADGPGGDPAFDVYCDQDTAGGGWVLIAYWTSGTDRYYTWGDVATRGESMVPYTQDSLSYPVPPVGVVNTYTTQLFVYDQTPLPAAHRWFNTTIGAYVTYPMYEASDYPFSTSGFTGYTPSGSAVTLYPRATGWHATNSMTEPWGLWQSQGLGGLCGGAGTPGQKRCPSLYVPYLYHHDEWSPKFLFAR